MNLLRLVRIKHGLPLIQIWIPCVCDKSSSLTRLFCCWTSWDSALSREIYVRDERNVANGCYSVESGKGLVGRAYLQKKLCFMRNTRLLSISEYPLVHFTRSIGLTACFSILLKSPRFPFYVLEVFLPPEKNYVGGNVGLLLQAFLFTLAPGFTGPLSNKEFHVQYSHSDGENFVYFNVSKNRQTTRGGKALGNGRDEHHFQPSHKEDSDQNFHVAPRVESFSKSFASGDAEKVKDCTSHALGRSAVADTVNSRQNVHVIQSKNRRFVQAGGQVIQEPDICTCPAKKAKKSEAMDKNIIPESAKSKSTAPGNDEIGRGNRVIVKANYRGDIAKFFFWSNSGIEELHQELHKRFKLEVDKFKVKYKDDDGTWIVLSCDEDLLFHLETSETPGQIVLELLVLPVTD